MTGAVEGMDSARRVAWARYYELAEHVAAGCHVDCGFCGSTSTVVFRDGQWQAWTSGPRYAQRKAAPAAESIASIRALLLGPRRVNTGTGWPS